MKLEKRINQIERLDVITESIEGLQHYFNDIKETIISQVKESYPVKLFKASIDWEKASAIYDEGAKIIIESCGEGLLKEFPMLKKISRDRKTTDGYLEQIEDAFGCLEHYHSHGLRLIETGDRLDHMISLKEFSRKEKMILKPFLRQVAKEVRKGGNYVIDATKEASGYSSRRRTGNFNKFIN